MLQDFIFSVNIILPIFILLSLGMFLKTKDILDNKTISTINELVFFLALPVSLFRDVVNSNLRDIFDVRLITYAVLFNIIFFIVLWICAEIFIKDKSDIGAFVQASFRSNFAILGMSLIQNILGDKNTGKGALVLSCTIPVYNILAIMVLSSRNSDSQSQKINYKKVGLSILKNPLLIAIVLGFAVALSGIKLPTFFSKTIDYLSGLTTPLALIGIGASIFANRKALENIALVIWASFIKTILAPLIFVPFSYFFLNFNEEETVVFFIMFATPTAISSYVMASKMKSNPNLTANIIFVTTLLSLVTITIGIFLIKRLFPV